MADLDPRTRYVVLHTPGPNWQTGVGFREQPGVRDHVMHYAELFQQGKLEIGGPFLLDDTGGMMVTTTDVTAQEIRDFAAADPAVHAGLLNFEIRPWLAAMVREK